MNVILNKIEAMLIKITFVQFLFLIVAQILLYKKELSPYLSRTIFSEGVILKYATQSIEILDQLSSIWYDI